MPCLCGTGDSRCHLTSVNSCHASLATPRPGLSSLTTNITFTLLSAKPATVNVFLAVFVLRRRQVETMQGARRQNMPCGRTFLTKICMQPMHSWYLNPSPKLQKLQPDPQGIREEEGGERVHARQFHNRKLRGGGATRGGGGAGRGR